MAYRWPAALDVAEVLARIEADVHQLSGSEDVKPE
jgi:hypothetical protein